MIPFSLEILMVLWDFYSSNDYILKKKNPLHTIIGVCDGIAVFFIITQNLVVF